MSSNLIGPTWKHSSKEERSAVNGRMNVRFILFPQLKSKLILYMKNVINILQQIEKEYQVKILLACETGSRAWGFPSPDSDYDIRFIYMHERDWYLSLNEKKDTIEFIVNKELDITGWDFKKSLLLLKKSNAALIERFQSPIIYYEVNGFQDDFKKLITEYYSPAAAFYHYSLAKKFWEDIEGFQKFKLKNYFYMIRSMLSCNWMIKENDVLPMHIKGLIELIDDTRKLELQKLIELKSTVDENYLHTKEESLNKWLIELWDKIERAKDKLRVKSSDYTSLNDFFIKTINEKAVNRLG